jgi:hypothetical protein
MAAGLKVIRPMSRVRQGIARVRKGARLLHAAGVGRLCWVVMANA